MAETIDALVVHASRQAATADDLCADGTVDRDGVLQRLRRLIGGYLGLPDAP